MSSRPDVLTGLSKNLRDRVQAVTLQGGSQRWRTPRLIKGAGANPLKAESKCAK